MEFLCCETGDSQEHRLKGLAMFLCLSQSDCTENYRIELGEHG